MFEVSQGPLDPTSLATCKSMTLTLGSAITLVFVRFLVGYYRTHGDVYVLLITAFSIDVLDIVDDLAKVTDNWKIQGQRLPTSLRRAFRLMPRFSGSAPNI